MKKSVVGLGKEQSSYRTSETGWVFLILIFNFFCKIFLFFILFFIIFFYFFISILKKLKRKDFKFIRELDERIYSIMKMPFYSEIDEFLQGIFIIFLLN